MFSGTLAKVGWLAGLRSCPVCSSPQQAQFSVVDGQRYDECKACGLLYVADGRLAEIDRGANIVAYGADYWAAEGESARQRARGSSLARAAEALLYCRRPVERFLDIGSGGGELLMELRKRLPTSAGIFHGVEMNPPPGRDDQPYVTVGTVADLTDKFDAGVCIEVLEHLTPKMVDGLVASLAAVCRENSLFLFNTGLSEYTRHEDPAYLDPHGRGHIVSYSWTALEKLFEPHGFRIRRLGSRQWAFCAEYMPTSWDGDMHERVWTSPNVGLLDDPATDSVLFLLGRESARTA